MRTSGKIGGFLGALAAIQPAIILGGLHYVVSSLDGKDNKTAGDNFKETFDNVYKTGEKYGAKLMEKAVSISSDLFDEFNKKTAAQ
ncbi:hypothetical protein [Emticicia sp. 17c]|uniref:hypothetical protein n=1 Tax=Emticicia sp. 17c TaxID=3127704 RepID=UPI00301BA402